MNPQFLSPEGLPIIDLSCSNIDLLRDAVEHSGCFYISGLEHILPKFKVASLMNSTRSFFQLPKETKMACVSKESNLLGRGYFPYKSENVGAFMGCKGEPNDLVEKFAVGPKECPDHLKKLDEIQGMYWAPNIWPENHPTFQSDVEWFVDTMSNLAMQVMQLFSRALMMPPDYIAKTFDVPGAHSLKINFYPPQNSSESSQLAFAEHTDSSPFTLLLCDETRDTLSIKRMDGEWVFANPIPGTVFVNLGDMMQRWTSGKWCATPHKVFSSNASRISFAFFVLPNPIVRIGSVVKEHQDEISYHEYIKEKLAALALK